MASVGSATNTAVETAAAHKVQCRVNYEYMIAWCNFDEDKLKQYKEKYGMHKDEICLGVMKPMNSAPSRINNARHAYRSIVTTLGDMDLAATNFLKMVFHNSTDIASRKIIVDYVMHNLESWVDPNTLNRDAVIRQIKEMPEFTFQGVSVGFAFAHPHSGDNMATSQIGGLITISNGAFPIVCGDMVQFYFDFEEDCFDQNGKRHPQPIPMTNSSSVSMLNKHVFQNKQLKGLEKDRHTLIQREFGANSMHRKKNVALIKPYIPCEIDDRVYDFQRVFARAITNARPYDKVDIMIFRQAQ